IRHLILPAIALGAIQAAVIARMTRSSMIDILSLNYIKTAKAKGVTNNVVIYKHALRNALIPILTILGDTFGALITGAVVTETVFNLPGLGQLILNVIIDLLYGVINPKVRLSKK